MSYALDSLVAHLDAAVGASSGTFSATEKHSALVSACEQHISATGCSVTLQDLTVPSGASSIDVTSTVAGFTTNDMVGDTGWIDNYAVRRVGTQKVMRRHEGSSTSGQPTQMAFLGDDLLKFNTEADQEYTLKLPIVAALVSYTLGTASNPSLNIPQRDAPEIARLGGKAYLLHGEEGNESVKAMVDFEKFIEAAKARYPNTNDAVRDRNVQP